MLRGLKLVDPEAPNSERSDQFALGDDLLFAPVCHGAIRSADHPYRFDVSLRRRVWHASSLLPARPRGNEIPDDSPIEIGYDREIRLNALNTSEVTRRWGERFYVAWDGSFRVETAGWYRLALTGNGHKALTIDGDELPQLLAYFDGGGQEINLPIEAGSHSILVTYKHDGSVHCSANLAIERLTPLDQLPTLSRPVWLPAGSWRDLWDGSVTEGPCLVTVDTSIARIPAFVRNGAIIPVGEVGTKTAPLSRYAFDVFVSGRDFSTQRQICEDDGETRAYERGEVRTTVVHASRSGAVLDLATESPEDERLPVTYRLHLVPGERVSSVRAGTQTLSPPARDSSWRLLDPPASTRETPLALDDESAQFADADTVVIDLPAEHASQPILVEIARRT